METYAIDSETRVDFDPDDRVRDVRGACDSRSAADTGALPGFVGEARRDDPDARWGEAAHGDLFAEECGGSAANLDGAHALRNRQPGHRHQQHDLPVRGHVCGWLHFCVPGYSRPVRIRGQVHDAAY